MKHKKILTVCAAVILCTVLPVQPVCAQKTINADAAEDLQNSVSVSGETLMGDDLNVDPSEGEQPTDDASTGEQPSDNPSAGEQPTDDTPAGEQPSDDTPDDTPPEETLQEPGEVTGLHTTAQSDKRVLLEWNVCSGAAFYQVYRKTGNDDYEMIWETEKPSYTDTDVSFGKIYWYKVIPFSQEGNAGKEAVIRLAHTRAVNIKTQKYTYQQMKADMGELAKQYSDYCELRPIGVSVQGRTIYDLVIGNPNAKQSLLVVSTLHAREYVCSAMLMQEIEYYLRHYNGTIGGMKPAKVLQDMQIHYVVMANPDGVTISQKKNARWKANSRGVDLNRNFPAKKFVVGGTRGSAGFSGKKPLSEPEAKAVAALTQDLKKNQHLCGVINYHAMGQIVFGDCSHKKLKKDTQKMYLIARKLTGYRSAAGYSSGKKSSGGSYREYVMDLLSLPSITIEVGSTVAPCSYWEYGSVFQKNKLVVLKIADAL